MVNPKTGKVDVTTPEWHKVFNVFVDYVLKGGMTKDALGWSWTDSPEMFGKGKAAMAMVGSSDVTFYEDPARYGPIQGDWTPMPPWPFDKGLPRASYNSAANWSVNPFIPDNQKAAALLWMDYYRSYEAQWNEAFFEGNECYVSNLYKVEENKTYVNYPDVRAETLKAMGSEILPPNGDTILKYIHEYWQKACLGQISVDEALSSAQKSIDELQ
jgi:ABC-type glycerol-3-phosphate transport system substrate-binding protein